MWENLKVTQKILTDRILDQHNLDPAEIVEERQLAIIDEILEYAKSTRCFKVWSKRDPDPIQTRLEEFADGLHLYLEWFNEFEVTGQEIESLCLNRIDTKSLTPKNEQITWMLNKAIRCLYKAWDPLEYPQIKRGFILESFSCFWAAGAVDGLTSADIEKAYYLKNQKNHQRQKEGY